MKPMENLEKLIHRSLGLLDNHYVRLILVLLLVAYSAGVMPSLNREISAGLSNVFGRLLVLLGIMYISVKDVPLAMLLAIAYVLTVHMSGGNIENMHCDSDKEEGFEGSSSQDGSSHDGSAHDGSAHHDSAHHDSVHGATEAEDENDAESPASLTEGLDMNEKVFVPSGYKPSNNSCLQDCANGESLPQGPTGQCGSTATWKGENNAQGMNCPMGYGGEELATF